MGTGCGHNSKAVWSSTPCGDKGHFVAVTAARQMSCANAKKNLAVRCCADREREKKGGQKCDLFASEEARCTSALSCATLQSNAGRGSWPSESGDSAVCGESDDGLGPQGSKRCYGGNTKYDRTSWREASNVCGKAGARLCTIEELQADETRNTGCGHDLKLVWTSDDIGCKLGQHAAVAGSTSAGNKAVPCRSDSFSAAVRCCGDARVGATVCKGSIGGYHQKFHSAPTPSPSPTPVKHGPCGQWGVHLDACGVCGGDGKSCLDCAGVVVSYLHSSAECYYMTM